MAEIFGLDVQALVAEAIQSAGGLTAAVLVKAVPGGRDTSNPTVLLASTTTRHTLELAVETKQSRRPGSVVSETLLICTIITGTISPPAVPAVNDTIEVGGVSYTLIQLLQADPAGATHAFEVQ